LLSPRTSFPPEKKPAFQSGEREGGANAPPQYEKMSCERGAILKGVPSGGPGAGNVQERGPSRPPSGGEAIL